MIYLEDLTKNHLWIGNVGTGIHTNLYYLLFFSHRVFSNLVNVIFIYNTSVLGGFMIANSLWIGAHSWINKYRLIL